MPFHEALEKIGKRSPIGSRLNSSEWSKVSVELRERAFFSSRVQSARFLQSAKNGITDFLAANTEQLANGETALKTGSRAQFIQQMREFALREGMGPLVPEDKGTLKDITSEKRLGLIFDVQTRQAHDYGFYKQGLDPDVLNEFPAQRFIRVKGVKEPRGDHAKYEGKVFLKTDPIWRTINKDFGVPWGPWGWGCGHDVEDVDRQEAEALGLISPREKVEPPPHPFNSGLKASTRGLDFEIFQKLKDELGDSVSEQEGEIRWNE